MTQERVVNRRLFWTMAAAGAPLMLFGFFGVFNEARRTNPTHWFAWFLGVALFHDFVIAPAVFAVGIVLKKGLPPRVRAAIQAGLVVSALVVLISLPGLGGFGKHKLNATILPNDYVWGLAVVVAIAFGGAVIISWLGTQIPRRNQKAQPAGKQKAGR